LKLTNISQVHTAAIIRAMSCHVVLMMEAVRTSEISVNFKVTTWRYIAEESKLQADV
jgi:hypothetical protein